MIDGLYVNETLVRELMQDMARMRAEELQRSIHRLINFLPAEDLYTLRGILHLGLPCLYTVDGMIIQRMRTLGVRPEAGTRADDENAPGGRDEG